MNNQANRAIPEERYRVLAVATHPVQYMAPLLRRMAAHPALDLQVAYCTLRGAKAFRDPEFGANIQWDVPLLEGYPWSNLPNRGSDKESFLGLLNPGLWKLIRGGNYDAVLCFVGYVRASFWITWLAAKSSKACLLFGTDATSLIPRDGHTWKVAMKRLLWPRLFRLADQVIVPSTSSAQIMVELGIPEHRISLTPFVADNDWWIERAGRVDRTTVRASWGVSAHDTVILFSAKLQPWKRPLDLLHAFAKADLPTAHLVFAGEGPLRSRLEAEAAALGVASRVRFLGFMNQSQLPAVYTAADLLVLPSEFEPFGVVVNEAMCCGCPAAVSDRCGAARDLVAPISAELVFPCGDIEALAGILRDASSNPTRLLALARAARAHIHNWSPERNVAATVEAISAALSRIHSAKANNSAASVPNLRSRA